MTEKEVRYYPAEMRIDQEGRIEGYAAVFNQWSQVLGFFKERIRKGAFSKTIKEADIRCLFNHDASQVLGRNTAGTLELSEDDHGLQFLVNPPDAQWANDLQKSIKRGDIDQGSFGFEAVRDEWDHNSEPMKRELIELKLSDVSIVTFPAYTQTHVTVRALAEMFISRVQHTEDPESIRFMLEQLDKIVATSAPGQEIHPEDGQSGAEQQPTGNALRERRLELERLKII